MFHSHPVAPSFRFPALGLAATRALTPLALATLPLGATLMLGGCGKGQEAPPQQEAPVGYIVATPTAVPVSTELA